MAIPKELQSAYQRWEMTSFGDERPSTLAQRAAAREAEARDAQAAMAAAQAARAASLAPPAPAVVLPTIEEIEAIREAARQEGYAEGHAEGVQAGHASGYEDGLAQGRAESARELTHLQELATRFGDAVTAADEAIAADVLELAVQLARGMVRIAFEVRPELIIPVVREAVDYLPTLQQPALLTLHPEDALVVQSGIGQELEKSGWRIVEDETLARGGCRVDTASNQIDAQIASRWQRLANALGSDLEWLA
ncbi:flagellar assembly protein FliH [Massilia forsythiae]|uniref:Flagellar assembly protein FliH n=1 Tax=Massilia forsythiae TaxID=2728020 RepID=A0A7Z2ZT76_9BURK|nr:flagellar assembly protein FliH [Massilia forsythiae]QJE00940.1 flagellar assembly protein FliH [Massilia forsythiae]